MLNSISSFLFSNGTRSEAREQELLDALDNLEQQLSVLYEEKERNAQHTSTGEIEVLRETVASMEAQLRALYSDKEQNGDSAPLREMIGSLEEQLVSLYRERETHGSFNATSAHVSRIEAHYEALRSQYTEMIASLEQQLCSLYQERERTASISISTFESMEDQLVSLYREKEEWLAETRGAWDMVESLEQQVGALLDEKTELILELTKLRAHLEDQHERARRLGAAVFEAALCDKRGPR